MRGHSSDALLAQLLAEVEDHELAARRPLAAERQMDEAAVLHHPRLLPADAQAERLRVGRPL